MTEPTGAPEPRKTIEALAAEHRAPRAAWIVAIVLGAFSLWKLATENGEHLWVHIGMLIGAVLCVPGLAPWLADNVRTFGTAVADVASKLMAFLPGKKP